MYAKSPPRSPIPDAPESVSVTGYDGPYLATNVVTLTCDYVDGYPAADIAWYRDGSVISGETMTTLTLTLADSDHDAVFTCEASNDVSAVASSNSVTMEIDSELFYIG